MDHTPSPLVQVKEVNISKGEGRWEIIDVHIIPQSKPYEKVFKLDTVQDKEKTTIYVPIVVMLPAILGPIFCDEENVMGVARNCESMGRAKGQGGEMACLPYY